MQVHRLKHEEDMGPLRGPLRGALPVLWGLVIWQTKQNHVRVPRSKSSLLQHSQAGPWPSLSKLGGHQSCQEHSPSKLETAAGWNWLFFPGHYKINP